MRKGTFQAHPGRQRFGGAFDLKRIFTLATFFISDIFLYFCLTGKTSQLIVSSYWTTKECNNFSVIQLLKRKDVARTAVPRKR